jgi:hypothetical protein
METLDPDWIRIVIQPKMTDPNPKKSINPDPKHWYYRTATTLYSPLPPPPTLNKVRFVMHLGPRENEKLPNAPPSFCKKGFKDKNCNFLISLKGQAIPYRYSRRLPVRYIIIIMSFLVFLLPRVSTFDDEEKN